MKIFYSLGKSGKNSQWKLTDKLLWLLQKNFSRKKGTAFLLLPFIRKAIHCIFNLPYFYLKVNMHY